MSHQELRIQVRGFSTEYISRFTGLIGSDLKARFERFLSAHSEGFRTTGEALKAFRDFTISELSN